MKTLLEHVSEWGAENKVEFMRQSERIQFMVDSENDSFTMVCSSMEEERVFICLCGYGMAVPEERRAAVASEILALNYILKWGAFQLDATNGELTFRACQLIPIEDAQAREMIEKTITFSAQVLTFSRDKVKGWLL